MPSGPVSSVVRLPRTAKNACRAPDVSGDVVLLATAGSAGRGLPPGLVVGDVTDHHHIADLRPGADAASDAHEHDTGGAVVLEELAVGDDGGSLPRSRACVATTDARWPPAGTFAS